MKKMIQPKSGGDGDYNVWIYCTALGLLIPILIPALQCGVIFRIWDRYNKPVNKDMCACSCWDTVFKGCMSLALSKYRLSIPYFIECT